MLIPNFRQVMSFRRSCDASPGTWPFWERARQRAPSPSWETSGTGEVALVVVEFECSSPPFKIRIASAQEEIFISSFEINRTSFLFIQTKLEKN